MRAAGNRKAGCGVIGRRPINDHAINNVIAAKDATDNATKKRCRNSVGVLGRMGNDRLRFHIANIKIAYHAAIAIGNEAAKSALIVFDLNCCRLRGAKVANNNAAERVSLIAKATKRSRV